MCPTLIPKSVMSSQIIERTLKRLERDNFVLAPSCYATLQKVMGPKYGTTPKKDLYQLMQVFNPRIMRKQEIVII